MTRKYILNHISTGRRSEVLALEFIPSFFEKLVVTICFGILILTSCKRQIEVSPPVTSINGDNVYATDATAAAVLTGIYTKMSLGTSTNGVTSMSLLTSLSSDELSLYSTSLDYQLYYTNNLNSQNSTAGNFWMSLYPLVFYANSAIEGLSSSTSLTESVKLQLLGEAKFLRAFSYYYLVSLYGGVPLVSTTDWKINSQLARASTSKVWEQIISDLKDAQTFLNSNYLTADVLSVTNERVRPTKGAATALLARAYLFLEDYENAEVQSSQIIANSVKYSLDTLNGVFLKNSNEAIWQLPSVLMSSGVNANTWEGRLFVLPTSGPNLSNYPVYLSTGFVNSFEANDLRKIKWIGNVTTAPPASFTYYYPNKYKIGANNTTQQEYSMVLRLAEQYLIRAEARAQRNNLSGAREDLNAIRLRAGLSGVITNDRQSLIDSIMRERRHELFTEWGHRWLDLKRTNTIDNVMNSMALIKGGSWQTTDQFYPIPQSELEKAPNIIQNDGY